MRTTYRHQRTLRSFFGYCFCQANGKNFLTQSGTVELDDLKELLCMNVIRSISQQTLQRPSRGRLRSFRICQELRQPGLWSGTDPRRTAAPEDTEIPFSGPQQQPPSGGPIPLFISSCPLSGQASKSLLELHCNCKCLFPDYKCEKKKNTHIHYGTFGKCREAHIEKQSQKEILETVIQWLLFGRRDLRCF